MLQVTYFIIIAGLFEIKYSDEYPNDRMIEIEIRKLFPTGEIDNQKVYAKVEKRYSISPYN